MVNTPYVDSLFWKHAALLANGRRGNWNVYEEIKRLHWAYFQDDVDPRQYRQDMSKIARMVGV